MIPYDLPFGEWCDPEELADAIYHDAVCPIGYPSRVFQLAVDHLNWRLEQLESPAEKLFLTGWFRANGPYLNAQLELLGGRYRVDFAHAPSRTAIEIDGLAYHGDQAAFRRDRERDRRLTAAGWRVVRFTAKEVFDDPDRCAREALAFCQDAAS